MEMRICWLLVIKNILNLRKVEEYGDGLLLGLDFGKQCGPNGRLHPIGLAMLRLEYRSHGKVNENDSTSVSLLTIFSPPCAIFSQQKSSEIG